MKNRMYYLLLPVYLFVVGFVLIVNGVFTGQVMSVSNLVINHDVPAVDWHLVSDLFFQFFPAEPYDGQTVE